MDLKMLTQVLLVEDDIEVGKAIRDVLMPFTSVNWAQDGEKVQSLLMQDPPDLVLLDIGLPGLDGLEICKNIKELAGFESLPVVFITGNTDPQVEARGLALGAVDFIVKPIYPDMLRMKVKTHLELKVHRDELKKIIESQTREILQNQQGIIASMAVLAECRDEETGKHIKRTKRYVQVLVENLKNAGGPYQNEDFDLMVESAILHDLGKIGIHDHILVKPGRLTRDEYEIIKAHTLLGSDAIAQAEKLFGSTPFLRKAREIAEFHHERWDGSGYPHGLEGTAIPLCARIMAIADVYDALTTVRSYKNRLSHADAVKLISKESKGHFDPVILQAFLSAESEFQKISSEYHSQQLF